MMSDGCCASEMMEEPSQRSQSAGWRLPTSLESVQDGACLVLHSLVGAAHLNGKRAVCIGRSNGRLEVQIQETKSKVRVKHGNVRLLPKSHDGLGKHVPSALVDHSYKSDEAVPSQEYVGG